jgi:PAS domain S-box-containing protein
MSAQNNSPVVPPEPSVKKKFKSLSVRLSIIFLGLGAAVLLINGALNLYFNFQKEQSLIASNQIRIAQDAANAVSEFIAEKIRVIEQSVYVNDLITTPDRRELVLNKLIGRVPAFRQLLLIDKTGKELQKVSRLSNSVSMHLLATEKSALLSAIKAGKSYMGDVYFDHETQEPIIVVAASAKNVFGDVQGALIAEVNLKFMWDLVGNMKIGKDGLAYVVDNKGNLIAFGDISRVLKGENLSNLNEVKEFVENADKTGDSSVEIEKGIQNNGYVVSNYVSLGSPNWAVIIELPVFEAYGPLISELGISILIILGSLLCSIIAITYFSKKITKPIVILTEAAVQIGAGSFDHKIEINSNDEIGILANTFNQMTSNLKQKVTELSMEHSRLTASVNSLTLGFMIVDNQHRILNINLAARKILELEESELTIDGLQQELKGKLDLVSRIIITLGTRKAVELKEVPYNNKFLHIFIAPIIDQSQTIGVVVLVEDITEAKLIERSRDEFFSIASHELRTPLTAIRGNTALIKQYYWDKLKDKDLREMVEDIHESSTRLIGIVNDFLDTSRLELGKMEFKKEEVDVEVLIENVLKEYITTGSMKKLYLKTEKPNFKVPLVIADKDRVKQIIINLVGNAIKFTEKGGVTVAIKLEKDLVKVLVSDTGKGISPESQNLLFRKFQQAAESIFTRDAIHGTGLGLYISRMMVEGMGGKIKLESSVVDKGSVFSISLPTKGKITTEKK